MDVDGPVDPFNDLDACPIGADILLGVHAPFIGSDDFSGPKAADNHSYDTRCDSAVCDLGEIVDSLFRSPRSASLDSFPTNRLTWQAKPKLAEVPGDDYLHLDSCDVVRDSSFTRVGRKGDDTEMIPWLLGFGKWRRLKGGITMDSGCSIDTVPTGHAPNVAMGPVPASRVNSRINAANGTRIREHGVKQLKFRTREGLKQDWKLLFTDVKKALESVATTCDGDGGGECHVLFTRHGGTIINVDSLGGSYTVGKTGIVKGVGEFTAFDRTGNTYGMEAWVYVGQSDKTEDFAQLVAAP